MEYYNKDLEWDIERIMGQEHKQIFKAEDFELDSPYAIDLEDDSYFYTKKEHRDHDYDNLKKHINEEGTK